MPDPSSIRRIQHDADPTIVLTGNRHADERRIGQDDCLARRAIVRERRGQQLVRRRSGEAFTGICSSAPGRIRMALRNTALIRVPQIRRRPGRLCQNTCHGFLRPYGVALSHGAASRCTTPGERARNRRPAPTSAALRTSKPRPSHQRVSTPAPASLAPRTNERRPSHQQASPSHQRASPFAPASLRPSHQRASPFAPRKPRPRTNERRPSHQQASTLAPTSVALRTSKPRPPHQHTSPLAPTSVDPRTSRPRAPHQRVPPSLALSHRHHEAARVRSGDS